MRLNGKTTLIGTIVATLMLSGSISWGVYTLISDYTRLGQNVSTNKTDNDRQDKRLAQLSSELQRRYEETDNDYVKKTDFNRRLSDLHYEFEQWINYLLYRSDQITGAHIIDHGDNK